MQETFLSEFQKRGYFNQCTDQIALGELMSKSKTSYAASHIEDYCAGENAAFA